jgi:hypothetical protein
MHWAATSSISVHRAGSYTPAWPVRVIILCIPTTCWHCSYTSGDPLTLVLTFCNLALAMSLTPVFLLIGLTPTTTITILTVNCTLTVLAQVWVLCASASAAQALAPSGGADAPDHWEPEAYLPSLGT